MHINLDLQKLPKLILPAFLPLIKRPEKILVLRGGAGSGKSVFATQYFLLKILVGMARNYKNRILVVRKTAASIRESVFQEFKNTISMWGLRDLVTANKSNFSFDFIDGSQIISAGLDDSEKIKSISGITSIWIEESNQITLEDFRQLKLRMRGKELRKPKIILSFNPVSKMNWLYKHLYEYKQRNVFLHHSTFRDNKFLDDEYREQLEELIEQDENYYRIYSEGEWGSLEGRVFSNYTIIDEFPEEKFKEKIYGLDFGFSVPSSLVKIAEYDGDLYLKELIYRKKLTNTELIEAVNYEIPKKHKSSAYIYADSAEPDRIQEFVNNGFNCFPADKSVKMGIDFLRRKRMFIHKDSTNLIGELENYIYKQDKSGESMEEPIKMKDHAIDASRYASYTHYKDSGAFLVS